MKKGTTRGRPAIHYLCLYNTYLLYSYTRPWQFTHDILKSGILALLSTRHVVSTGFRYCFSLSIVSKYISSMCAYYSLCLHSAALRQCGGYTVGVRVALNTSGIRSGERSQNAFDSADKHCNLPIFQWRLLCFIGRLHREFDTYDPHCAIFFFIPGGTQAIFLDQTPTASEGALLCDFLLQLHGALHTSYSNEVPRLSVVIFQLERSRGRPLGQAVPSCLAAVS